MGFGFFSQSSSSDFCRRLPAGDLPAAVLVVVDPPGFDFLLRVRQVGKPVFVEALVSEAAVETFDESVLVGLGNC